MFTGQTNFLQSLGWAVLNSFWQMAFLWAIWKVLSGLFPRAKAGANSLAATSLLFAGFGWFLFTFFTSFSVINRSGNAMTFTSIQGMPETLNNSLLTFLTYASVIYLVLLIIPILRFIRNFRYVKLIRQYGLQKISVDWRVFVNSIREQIGIRKKVEIWISDFVSSPVTIGFLKPIILVPLAAINNLEPAQMEAVLLHELAHIRRYDYLVNLLISCIKTILYFNPFAHALARLVEKEREKSCDELVLQFQYDARQYATALLMLEKSSHEAAPLIMAASGKRNDLLQRVEIILGVHKKAVFSFRKITGLITGLVIMAFFQVFLIRQHNAKAKVVLTSPGLTSTPIQISREYSPAIEKNEPVFTRNMLEEKRNSSGNNKVGLTQNRETGISAKVQDGMTQASYDLSDIPELNRLQEEQVKVAMEASRKVLENAHWKVMEKKIADVFNSSEKQAIRSSYQKAFSKMDWEVWENRLRQAYSKVDWDQVNDQLSLAVNQVRLDSLQTVYTAVEMKLRKVEEVLSGNAVSGIPDSDISLKNVEVKKQQAEALLKQILSARNKKIVHL